ncbi:MAG: GntR family transcriptional regulator [Clostridiales bacterium]|nr:GntR family transcriptional regulator [Clostridiales bacterium]MDY4541273.1 GntR family transcriptional regulator [Candidatus Ventricola sp.]
MAKRGNKVEQVYAYLLNEIVKGHYTNNDHIVINEVAAACGVSDTPVREALRRLESDSYVKITANQGAVVVGFSREAIIHTFEIKGMLEGYASRLSIDYLSPYDINMLRKINEDMHTAALEKQYDRFSQLNIDFHMYIYERCPMPELTSLIRDLWKKWSITKSVFSTAPTRMEESYQEHLQIISLIEQRDAEGIERFMRQHKANAARSMTMRLDEQSEAH